MDILSSFLLSSPSVNTSIRDAFLDDTLASHNIDQMQTLALYLESIISANKYAYSCYLYYDNDFGRFIMTQNGLSYIRSYSHEDWLGRYQDSPVDFWCETTQLDTYSSARKKDVLAMYQKLYSPYSATLSRGVLVTFFSMDSIRDYIGHFDLYPDQTILFLQDDGSIYFQTDSRDYSGLWSQIRHHITPDSSYLNFNMEFLDETYVASLALSSRDGWYYLSLVPNRNLYQHTRSLTSAFLLVAILSIVFGMILSMRTARYDYAQLQSIMELFHKADSQVWQQEKTVLKKNDPYQVILHHIISLFIEQHYLQLQVTNKQYQMQLLEIQSLQHQINPHFLFNTLHTIYWEAIRFTGQPNTCSAMISDLSEIMAYSLTDAQDKVPIRKELEYLQHYTNIQEVRYGHKFTISWDVSPQALDNAIIKMVFQPLVENSIYHGLKEKNSPGHIRIKIYDQGEKILIHILDNGIGMDAGRLQQMRGRLQNGTEPLDHIGLLNTSHRLELTYGEASRIRLYSRRNRGTIVSFQIPAERLAEKSFP